jgi:hypothetical protein
MRGNEDDFEKGQDVKEIASHCIVVTELVE